ncbi:hypothetical protein X777_06756 [Ooceraea biroi]|uniref:Uncharacterized protein n=1 Tax=Ooceraea biroi TaxID=2015173 RepID=A0A026X194_OOCBI|nr:hypothetical protein X777_06756 [Ooceraea biroi]
MINRFAVQTSQFSQIISNANIRKDQVSFRSIVAHRTPAQDRSQLQNAGEVDRVQYVSPLLVPESDVDMID